MDDAHTESELLRCMWRYLNQECFDSSLSEPKSIGWLDLSGQQDLREEFGYYFPRLNGIALSQRFKYAELQDAECKKIAANQTLSVQERTAAMLTFNAKEIVLRLLAHEMVHQSSHQAGDSAVSHGESFLKHAEQVAKGLDIAAPTLSDAHHWPDIQHFLRLETEAGHLKL